jgi:hypothetical protein
MYNVYEYKNRNAAVFHIPYENILDLTLFYKIKNECNPMPHFKTSH